MMCGGVYEDELKEEAVIDNIKQTTDKTQENLSGQEEDGYYYPGSDPQQ